MTLTYAASLDGMISHGPGERTILSGPETKSMTHYLRMHHDAILVGVGTAIADDPSLNCRYPRATQQPRPVVIDPSSRWDPSGSKVLQLSRLNNTGKAPWIVCTSRVSEHERLAETGVERLILQDDSPLSWAAILKAVKQKGVQRIMIEGGATVIKGLLAEPNLVDSVIVTLAPTWLGEGGILATGTPKINANKERSNAARLRDTAWRQFGADAVLCGRLQSE